MQLVLLFVLEIFDAEEGDAEERGEDEEEDEQAFFADLGGPDS